MLHDAPNFPQTVPAQQQMDERPQRMVFGKSPLLSSGTQRGIKELLEENLQRMELHSNSIKMVQHNLRDKRICWRVRQGTWLIPMTEICNFHSQIWDKDLCPMLKGSRFLQQLNGNQRSHLHTQVLPMMTSTYGHHWSGSILCLCKALPRKRWNLQQLY